MRRIVQRIINAGAKCHFCRPNKIPAVWKAEGILDHKKIACDAHKDLIIDPPFKLDGHYTEVDEQTWRRL